MLDDLSVVPEEVTVRLGADLGLLLSLTLSDDGGQAKGCGVGTKGITRHGVSLCPRPRARSQPAHRYQEEDADAQLLPL